ncbi:MAG: hypothetical protein WCA35_13695 [Kovacikia sp.]
MWAKTWAMTASIAAEGPALPMGIAGVIAGVIELAILKSICFDLAISFRI